MGVRSREFAPPANLLKSPQEVHLDGQSGAPPVLVLTTPQPGSSSSSGNSSSSSSGSSGTSSSSGGSGGVQSSSNLKSAKERAFAPGQARVVNKTWQAPTLASHWQYQVRARTDGRRGAAARRSSRFSRAGGG
jgi:hypothetical protein